MHSISYGGTLLNLTIFWVFSCSDFQPYIFSIYLFLFYSENFYFMNVILFMKEDNFNVIYHILSSLIIEIDYKTSFQLNFILFYFFW